jgi:hypothetical protein
MCSRPATIQKVQLKKFLKPREIKFTKNDFGGVKLHFWFVENTVLGQVVVQVAAVHQVQNEAEFVGRVECVRHAHYERTVHLLRTKHIL